MPRPRPPTRNATLVSLSSPSSGAESPAGSRRSNEAPSNSDSFTTPPSLRHHSMNQKQNVSQTLVPVAQGTTYSTNPYVDSSQRLNPGLYSLTNVNTRSPNVHARSHQASRNPLHPPAPPNRGSPAAPVPEEPSPFDQVKFPPPTKKSVRFSPQTAVSSLGGNRATYQTQRSLLDENMGEEKDVHNPLLSIKPHQEQSKNFEPAKSEDKPFYNYAELEREFLTWIYGLCSENLNWSWIKNDNFCL